jgi:hypothetical protein
MRCRMVGWGSTMLIAAVDLLRLAGPRIVQVRTSLRSHSIVWVWIMLSIVA